MHEKSSVPPFLCVRYLAPKDWAFLKIFFEPACLRLRNVPMLVRLALPVLCLPSSTDEFLSLATPNMDPRCIVAIPHMGICLLEGYRVECITLSQPSLKHAKEVQVAA